MRGNAACRTVSARPPPALAALACPTIETYHCIYNYSADAGAGSQIIKGLAGSAGWRAALLGTVAAGALWLGAPRYARAGPDPCALSGGTTATCSGDQSDGIASGTDFPAAYTTLNVNGLTTNIAPAPGVDGIYFHGTTSVNIISNTTPFGIFAAGDGINADALLGAVTIDHTGDITSNGFGIYALSHGGGIVGVTSKGNINANSAAIFARGSDAVTVDSTGDIDSTNGSGIFAFSSGSTVNINHHSGTITANPDGVNFYHAIDARGSLGVTVDHTGDITSTYGRGISADSAAAPSALPTTAAPSWRSVPASLPATSG